MFIFAFHCCLHFYQYFFVTSLLFAPMIKFLFIFDEKTKIHCRLLVCFSSYSYTCFAAWCDNAIFCLKKTPRHLILLNRCILVQGTKLTAKLHFPHLENPAAQGTNPNLWYSLRFPHCVDTANTAIVYRGTKSGISCRSRSQYLNFWHHSPLIYFYSPGKNCEKLTLFDKSLLCIYNNQSQNIST